MSHHFKVIADLLSVVPSAMKRASATLMGASYASVTPELTSSEDRTDDVCLNRAIVEQYRCPEDLLDWELSGTLSEDAGYFRFGANTVCYGHSSCGSRQPGPNAELSDLSHDGTVGSGRVQLPFNPTALIDNLRLERYSPNINAGFQSVLKKAYYVARPIMGVALRSRIQQFRAKKFGTGSFPKWPVDTTVENLCEQFLLLSMKAKGVDRIPFIWFWPNGADACFCMTHDVETEAGRAFCKELMDLNDAYGLKASFQIVPEKRYEVSEEYLESIRSRGFEVAVHDLNHDGRLYDDKEEFLHRAGKISQYAAKWGAKGFRAGALYRNQRWFADLGIAYDMSVPNVAHLDPQPGGCCSVMPYFVGDVLEIPVTAVQDYMLFHILQSRSLDLWKTQIDAIMKKSGLISFIVHPDYIIDQDTKSVYTDLLAYLRELRAQTDAWFALPRDIDAWWRNRRQMHLERAGNSWKIVGPGAERAVLAFAKQAEDGSLVYELEGATVTR